MQLVEAIVLPMTHKERFENLGIAPPKGTVKITLVTANHCGDYGNYEEQFPSTDCWPTVGRLDRVSWIEFIDYLVRACQVKYICW